MAAANLSRVMKEQLERHAVLGLCNKPRGVMPPHIKRIPPSAFRLMKMHEEGMMTSDEKLNTQFVFEKSIPGLVEAGVFDQMTEAEAELVVKEITEFAAAAVTRCHDIRKAGTGHEEFYGNVKHFLIIGLVKFHGFISRVKDFSVVAKYAAGISSNETSDRLAAIELAVENGMIEAKEDLVNLLGSKNRDEQFAAIDAMHSLGLDKELLEELKSEYPDEMEGNLLAKKPEDIITIIKLHISTGLEGLSAYGNWVERKGEVATISNFKNAVKIGGEALREGIKKAAEAGLVEAQEDMLEIFRSGDKENMIAVIRAFEQMNISSLLVEDAKEKYPQCFNLPPWDAGTDQEGNKLSLRKVELVLTVGENEGAKYMPYIGSGGDIKAIVDIVRAFASGDKARVMWAIKNTAELKVKEALIDLMASFKNGDSEIKLAALKALEELGLTNEIVEEINREIRAKMTYQFLELTHDFTTNPKNSLRNSQQDLEDLRLSPGPKGSALFIDSSGDYRVYDPYENSVGDRHVIITPHAPNYGYAYSLESNKLFIFGGHDKEDYPTNMVIIDLEGNESARNIDCSKVMAGRIRHKMVAYGDGIFIHGGMRKATKETAQTVFDELIFYNAKTNHIYTYPGPELCGRKYAHQMLSHDGRIYLHGGFDSRTGISNDFWVYEVKNPETGEGVWKDLSSTVPKQMPKRANHTMVSGPDGKLYLFGGSDDEGNALKDLWAYDPHKRKWEDLSAFVPQEMKPRYYHGMAVLPDGAIYIAGGGYSEPEKNTVTWIEDIWKLTVPAAGFSQRPVTFDDLKAGALAEELKSNDKDRELAAIKELLAMDRRTLLMENLRSIHPEVFTINMEDISAQVPDKLKGFSDFTEAVADGGILYLLGGRETMSGEEKKTLFKYDINKGEVTDLSQFIPEAFRAGDNYQMTVANNGTLFVFGGGNVVRGLYRYFWSFDPANNTFKELSGKIPEKMRARKYHRIVAGKEGSIYIFGGQTKSTEPLADFWKYDISTEQFTDLSDIVAIGMRARYAHNMHVTPDGHIIVFGGSSSINQNINDAWEYDPENNSWKKIELIENSSPKPPHRYFAPKARPGSELALLLSNHDIHDLKVTVDVFRDNNRVIGPMFTTGREYNGWGGVHYVVSGDQLILFIPEFKDAKLHTSLFAWKASINIDSDAVIERLKQNLDASINFPFPFNLDDTLTE